MGRRSGWLAIVMLSLIATGDFIHAQRVDTLEEVAIVEQVGAQLPLDAQFMDDTGNLVRLSNYFVPGKPVLLSFNYSLCPQACSLQLSDLAQTLPRLEMTPGKDFEAISLSICPSDTAVRATNTKARYVRECGIPEASAGWHFLTGTEEQIERVAQAAGFRYKRIEQTGDYEHKTVLVVLTPAGVVASYDRGPPYREATLREAMARASRGEVGFVAPPDASAAAPTEASSSFLSCFAWNSGTPAGKAMIAMQISGIAVLLGLVTFILVQRRRKTSASDKAHL